MLMFSQSMVSVDALEVAIEVADRRFFLNGVMTRVELCGLIFGSQ